MFVELDVHLSLFATNEDQRLVDVSLSVNPDTTDDNSDNLVQLSVAPYSDRPAVCFSVAPSVARLGAFGRSTVSVTFTPPSQAAQLRGFMRGTLLYALSYIAI